MSNHKIINIIRKIIAFNLFMSIVRPITISFSNVTKYTKKMYTFQIACKSENYYKEEGKIHIMPMHACLIL